MPPAPGDLGPASAQGARGWLAYFDRLGSSPVHLAQAAHYVRSLDAEVGLEPTQRVLDVGCGAGAVAALLAPRVAEIWWWDPSPNMRSLAEGSTGDHPNARFCDLGAAPSGPGDGAPLGAPFDLILVNSVAQYMAPEELRGWLPRWRRMLAPNGRVVISDLIPPSHSSSFDIVDLFRFGVRHGSPIRVVRDSLGDVREYRRTSRDVPLVRVGIQELTAHAAEAGLETEALPRNLTHFRKRWTAILRPRAENGAAGSP